MDFKWSSPEINYIVTNSYSTISFTTMFHSLFTGSPPLSLDAISNLCKRTRSQSLDRDRKVTSDSVKNDDSFEIDEDLADPTLKMGLPQKAYEFGLEIGRYGIYSVAIHRLFLYF